jgi:hypothetical protein
VSNFSRQGYMRVLLYLWKTYPCCSFFFYSAWCFSFLLSVKLFDLYYSVYRGPSETVRGSNFYCSWFVCYSGLPFVPLWQKGEVIFIFGLGMYFQTGQVIFVPEWPKGEFVSILASFCVWTKSLMCKDAVKLDSTCQRIFRRLCTAKMIAFSFVRTLHCIEKLLFQLASVRTSQHPVRTSINDRSTSDSFQVQI